MLLILNCLPLNMLDSHDNDDHLAPQSFINPDEAGKELLCSTQIPTVPQALYRCCPE